jgi:nucleoside-diphosphate-sugar epimerase
MITAQRVLLTGATGFIGGNALKHLSQAGCETSLVFRSNKRPAIPSHGNIREFQIHMDSVEQWRPIIEQVDLVLHMAGATSGSVAEMEQANSNVTSALLQACADVPNPPTVVLLSSLSAAGPSQNGNRRSPQDLPCPVSAYGQSKLRGELEAIRYSNNVPLTILRPGIVFGPGDVEVVRLLYPIASLGLNPIAGWHEAHVSFVHVEDLIEAVFSAANRGSRCKREQTQAPTGSGIYFVADEEQITFSRFAKYVAKGLEIPRVRDIHFPIWFVDTVAWCTEQSFRVFGKKCTFNRDKVREAAAPSWSCDVRTTMDDLQWRPSLPLADRLQHFARSWKFDQRVKKV